MAKFPKGSKLRITADPIGKYNFKHWKVNGKIQDPNLFFKRSFTWIVDDTTTFEAVFENCETNKITTQVTGPGGNIVIINREGDELQSQSGVYTVETGSLVTVRIDLGPDSRFKECVVDGQIYTKIEDIKPIDVDHDVFIYLDTIKKPNEPNLRAGCEPIEGGSIEVKNKI